MNEEKNNNKIMMFIKEICISIALSLIMMLILSIVLSLTNVSENVIMPTVIFISTFCLFIGSFRISRKIKEKGIIYGAILGCLYMLILYIISSIINGKFGLNTNSLLMITSGIVGGAIGGIVGVNL